MIRRPGAGARPAAVRIAAGGIRSGRRRRHWPLHRHAEPGETTEINVHGFCLNYGLPFPGDVLQPTELASDPLRNAAIYSLANGYIDSNATDAACGRDGSGGN